VQAADGAAITVCRKSPLPTMESELDRMKGSIEWKLEGRFL